MAVPRRIEAISNTSDAMDVEWKGLQEKWKGIMAICVYNIYYIYICIMCIYNYIIYIYYVYIYMFGISLGLIQPSEIRNI